jgi:hypothetical protein
VKPNGQAPQVYGSALSVDSLRILASMTPSQLRALGKRLRTACHYGGRDEGDAMAGASIIVKAAEVA